MTLKKSQRIEIVIADAGPLISLARVDALETLLVFKDNVSLVITDFVEFEVTRHRDKHADAQRICEFISRYAGIVEIQETSIGKTMKQMVQMRELFEENETFRQLMLSNNTVPPIIPKDIGELSIVSYANEMITNPPGVPILILAEDDFFLHSGSALPGNVHILSTRAFLETLYELGQIPAAKVLWETIQNKRPGVNTAYVDRQAGKINTEWQSAIDSEKNQPC
jgi:hypothetical protein